MRRNLVIFVASWVIVGSACFSGDLPDTNSISGQIDQIIDQGCAYEGITPLEKCSDGEFLHNLA